MSEQNILFEHSAVEIVLKYLQKNNNYSWSNIEYVNEGRYAIIYGKPKIAIILKKEWFLKYGEVFKEEKGIGDTINCAELKEFYKRGVEDIFILYKNGSIYRIKLMDFLLKSLKWINKEGKEVRSISIHNYERVNKDGCFAKT